MTRRRMANVGLGNPGPELLDNKPTGNKERDALIKAAAKEAYEVFFKGTKLDFGICDAHAGVTVRFGIEPAYQYDPLKIIEIDPVVGRSSLTSGKAWGAYGSDIAKNKRFLIQYKTKSKFVRFVFKWHPILFPNQSKT